MLIPEPIGILKSQTCLIHSFYREGILFLVT